MQRGVKRAKRPAKGKRRRRRPELAFAITIIQPAEGATIQGYTEGFGIHFHAFGVCAMMAFHHADATLLEVDNPTGDGDMPVPNVTVTPVAVTELPLPSSAPGRWGFRFAGAPPDRPVRVKVRAFNASNTVLAARQVTVTCRSLT
jgi:hypothetical protein